MSGAVKAKPEAAPAGEPMQGRLEASAQMLDFQPGFYSVEVVATGITRVREGLSLPCIRLDPILPANGTGGRAYVSTLSDGGLILSGQHAAYLRAEGGAASVMLTIYKAAGSSAAPELRIRAIDASLLAAPPVAAIATLPSLPSLPLTLLAHVERSGDVEVPGGAWAGEPGLGAIEGFEVVPSGDLGPADIEYQAVLGKDWNTPWVSDGDFCGSRGLALPLLGVRIRLVGGARKRYVCSYWGAFSGRGELGPMTDGAALAGDGGVLQALRIVLSLRKTVSATTTKAAAKTKPAIPFEKPAAKPQPKTRPSSPAPKVARGARRRQPAPPVKPVKRS